MAPVPRPAKRQRGTRGQGGNAAEGPSTQGNSNDDSAKKAASFASIQAHRRSLGEEVDPGLLALFAPSPSPQTAAAQSPPPEQATDFESAFGAAGDAAIAQYGD